jgi:ferredoxin-NADP reductase
MSHSQTRKAKLQFSAACSAARQGDLQNAVKSHFGLDHKSEEPNDDANSVELGNLQVVLNDVGPLNQQQLHNVISPVVIDNVNTLHEPAIVRRNSTMTFLHRPISLRCGNAHASSMSPNMLRHMSAGLTRRFGAASNANLDGPIIDSDESDAKHLSRQKTMMASDAALRTVAGLDETENAHERVFADEDEDEDDASQDYSDPIKQTSCCTRLGASLALNGQVALFLLVHGLCTLGIFFHFFAKKWEQTGAGVPAAAPNYWQKRVVPGLEFGAMHTLLFTMALFPITMCRFSITKLRDTWLSKFIPFDYMVEFHKYLGYIMGIQLVATIVVFLFHFGHLCRQFNAGIEKQNFCDKFSEEIMLTGYAILATYLIMWSTSLFCVRGRRYYQFFYYMHHFFVVLYIVTLIHTLDSKVRNDGLKRSQTWKWLAVPLGVYIIDRLVVALTCKRTHIAHVRLFWNPKAMVINIKKPEGLVYKAGQFFQVNIPCLSRLQWHPFSVSSAPGDKYVHMCIRAVPGGWTEKLFDKLHSLQQEKVEQALENGTRSSVILQTELSAEDVPVKLMGPFGAPSQDVRLYEYAMLMGSGTGIVPMLSQVRDMLQCFRKNRGIADIALRRNAAVDYRKKLVSRTLNRKNNNQSVALVSADSSRASSAAPSPRCSSHLASPTISASGSPALSPHGSLAPSPCASPVVGKRGRLLVPPDTAAAASPRDQNGQADPSAVIGEMELEVQDITWQARVLRRFEGTRYGLYSMLLLCADLCIANLTISLTSLHMYTGTRHEIIQWAAGVTTVLYCLECPVRVASLWKEYGASSKRTLRAMADAVLCIPMLIGYFYMNIKTDARPSYDPGEEFTFMLIIVISAYYRFLWRWYTNPFAVRGAPRIWVPSETSEFEQDFSDTLKESGLGRLKCIKMLWVCRTLSVFRWLQDELAQLQDEAHALCPGFLDIQVHITSKRLSQDFIDASVLGTGLEDRVFHARPLLRPTFVALRKNLMEEFPGRVMRVGVFFSGNLSLEWDVQQLTSELISERRCLFYFATENDTLHWVGQTKDEVARRNGDKFNIDAAYRLEETPRAGGCSITTTGQS